MQEENGAAADLFWGVLACTLEQLSSTYHLAISPATGGAAKILTQSLDRNVSAPRFGSDGQTIYFIVDDDGTQNVATFVLNAANGSVSFGDGSRLGARPASGSVFVSSYAIGTGSPENTALSTKCKNPPVPNTTNLWLPRSFRVSFFAKNFLTAWSANSSR